MSATVEFSIRNDSKLPQDFKAEWPEELDPNMKSTCSKVMSVIWEVISWIIFPIKLMQWGCAYLRDYIYRVAVIPSSNYKNIAGFENHLQQLENKLLEDFQGQKVKITAPDGATLDAAFFPGEIKDKVILCTCGNGAIWQGMRDRLELIKPLGVSILMLNPREVGHSEGDMSSEGLALDVYTAYEYLIQELKFDPNFILQFGHSLGASYGSEGAALIQKKYQDKEIKMISDRSLCDLATETSAIIKQLGSRVVGNGCFGNMLCAIGGAIAPIGVKLLGMQINQREAFLSLKGGKGILFSSADQIIPETASLYRSIEEELPDDVDVIEMDVYETEDPGEEHNRQLNDRETTELYQLIQRLLELDKKFYFKPNPENSFSGYSFLQFQAQQVN